jgi:hypothetical protein
MATFWYPWVSRQPVRAGRIPRSSFNKGGQEDTLGGAPAERISWPEIPQNVPKGFGGVFRYEISVALLIAGFALALLYTELVTAYSLHSMLSRPGTWISVVLLSLVVGGLIACLVRFRKMNKIFQDAQRESLPPRQSLIY